jgi:SAM-dependent methyltransferase
VPTIPPEQANLSPREPHHHRHVAESFGTDAARYNRARPSYPDAMVTAIVTASPGPEVLDVGIGTGISAQPFRGAGCRVLGVEADARMADLARQRGFEVEVARIEDWDPAGRAFDAVIAGQAWHWVDPVAGAAKAAQVLRPGGRLALFWNVLQTPPELAQAFSAVYRRSMPDAPDFWSRPALELYAVMFAKASDGIRQAGGFGEPEQWRFDWERSYSRDEWLDQVPTFGGFSRYPPGAAKEMLAGIGAAVDAVGGRFTMPYATVVVTATRTGGSGGRPG